MLLASDRRHGTRCTVVVVVGCPYYTTHYTTTSPPPRPANIQPAAHGAPMVASPSPSVCIAVIYSLTKPSARALCPLGRQAIAWRLPCALAPQCEMTYAGQGPVSTRRPMRCWLWLLVLLLAALTALVRCTALAPTPRDRCRPTTHYLLCLSACLACPCTHPPLSLPCCYCCCRQHSPAFVRRIGDEVPPRQFASSLCLPAHPIGLSCAHPPIPQPAVGALSLALSQPRCLPATRLLGFTLILNVVPSPVNPRLTTVL